MDILVTNPVTFINSVAPLEARFIIFCATWLGIVAIVWSVAYVLFRRIPDHCVFAPLENLPRRFFNLFILLISVLAAYTVSVVLKNYFEIGRPDLLNIDLRPLMQLSDYGFPSSHAAFYSALATALFFMNERAGAYVGLLTLIIGAARIFAGVHTPLDIVGGFLLGIFLAVIVDFVAEKLSPRRYT
jgi:membrane-associated phospholipid phosphatase